MCRDIFNRGVFVVHVAGLRGIGFSFNYYTTATFPFKCDFGMGCVRDAAIPI